ncbi:hypothetical protein [Paenibacillus puerhi]|uniref:hypothetical protein n=1 Tax=Paenibacillus puerhi TaxID=2692622 RepID=UPI001357A658|nr:hypothetical protein [Paenibacillus puerhi]
MPQNGELIHEQTERKMQPFYWILTFECLSLLLLLALCLATLPVIVAFIYQGWVYLLLPALLGLWLIRISWRLLGKYVWENNHLSRYALYRHHVDYLQYDKKRRDFVQDSVPLQQIERALVGGYYALYH